MSQDEKKAPRSPGVAARPALARRRVRAGKRNKFLGVLAELKALGERSGALVGDAYVRVAGSVLERLEHFEDASAERRYRQRLRTEATALSLRQTAPKAPLPAQ